MEQANRSNIEVQISKIIFNALVKNQVIYLPQVGSLHVDRVSAELHRWDKLLPPRHVVKYSPEAEGISVVDAIMVEGGCSKEAAEIIYDRWYNTSKCDGGVEIIGVGRVVNSRFDVSSYLDNILNSELHKAIQLKRRRASWMWIGVSVVGCVLVGLIANMLFSRFTSSAEATDVVEPMPQVVEVVQEPVQEPEPQVVEAEVVKTVTEEVTTPSRQNIPTVANPRYRVVYGVFSVIENALKAEKIAQSKVSGVVTEIRPYGKMFLVSLCGSDDISECQYFIDNNEDKFQDLWIYKRRN